MLASTPDLGHTATQDRIRWQSTSKKASGWSSLTFTIPRAELPKSWPKSSWLLETHCTSLFLQHNRTLSDTPGQFQSQ